MSRNPRPSRLIGLVVVAGLFLSGCGYHFAASGDALPQGANTTDAADLELSGDVRYVNQTPSNFNSALEPTQYNQNMTVSASLKDLHAKKTIWSTRNVSAGEHTPVVPQTTVATTPTFLQQNLRANDVANLTDIQTAQSETSAYRDVMMQRLAQSLYAEMAEGF